MVAKQQGKLISVLLEPLTAEQFPMAFGQKIRTVEKTVSCLFPA
jgi:hypothetical protein